MGGFREGCAERNTSTVRCVGTKNELAVRTCFLFQETSFFVFHVIKKRAGIVSPFHHFRDNQFLFVVRWLLLVGVVCCCCCCCCCSCCLVIPVSSPEMHNYVILSMTATIVMMRAAMEAFLGETFSFEGFLDVKNSILGCFCFI